MLLDFFSLFQPKYNPLLGFFSAFPVEGMIMNFIASLRKVELPNNLELSFSGLICLFAKDEIANLGM